MRSDITTQNKRKAEPVGSGRAWVDATCSTSQPDQPVFRSGAVARMAGMPVSTLRVWEQRYQAVGPSTAASGHRFYTAAEVERVVLLRQLTTQGHSIGSLAALGMEQLRDVARTQASADAMTGADTELGNSSPAVGRTAHPSRGLRAPMRIVVVGQGMARRLRRPAVQRACVRPAQVVAVFESLADAAARAGSHPGTADLLLWQTTGLQDGPSADLTAARAAWPGCRVAIAYRFAGPSARDSFASTGALVVREPLDDPSLGVWLATLEASRADRAGQAGLGQGSSGQGAGAQIDPAMSGQATASPPPRRFDDATLTEFAGLSSDVACDCPGHLAELLLQLASFETYSAECASRSPADAELHAQLHHTAGMARAMFETALERVALAEGWPLP